MIADLPPDFPPVPWLIEEAGVPKLNGELTKEGRERMLVDEYSKRNAASPKFFKKLNEEYLIKILLLKEYKGREGDQEYAALLNEDFAEFLMHYFTTFTPRGYYSPDFTPSKQEIISVLNSFNNIDGLITSTHLILKDPEQSFGKWRDRNHREYHEYRNARVIEKIDDIFENNPYLK